MKVWVAVSKVVFDSTKRGGVVYGRAYKVTPRNPKDLDVIGHPLQLNAWNISHRVMDRVGFLVCVELSDSNFDKLLGEVSDSDGVDLAVTAVDSVSLAEGTVVRVPSELLWQLCGQSFALERSRLALLHIISDAHKDEK